MGLRTGQRHAQHPAFRRQSPGAHRTQAATVKARVKYLPGLLLLSATLAEASSTFRCGSALVSKGAPTVEVAGKCGEPSSRAFVGYKDVLDQYGFRNEVSVEEWVYGPRN